MSHFERLHEFERELRRLTKKYRSLPEDLRELENVLRVLPTGSGSNFAILHRSETVVVVKARLACKSLRERSLRVIYAYHGATVTFMYIELYFKGDKENENFERIVAYVKDQRKGSQG